MSDVGVGFFKAKYDRVGFLKAIDDKRICSFSVGIYFNIFKYILYELH